MDWQRSLAKIRTVETEILWLEPYRDFGLVPNPSASEIAIARTEERLGLRLPASYRSFLRLHDGWPRFFEGASLLGTSTLGRRLYEDLARAVFVAAETPVPEIGPPSRTRPGPRRLVPFGIDMQATTLFAFDADVVHEDGEYDVVCWINELGMRRESFPSFLEMVLELCEAERDDLVEPARKSA